MILHTKKGIIKRIDDLIKDKRKRIGSIESEYPDYPEEQQESIDRNNKETINQLNRIIKEMFE